MTTSTALTNCFYLHPGEQQSMAALKRALLPLRKNQLVAEKLKEAIIDFNRQNPRNPIVLVTVKKGSFTRGDMLWGSDIDWLTFYTDAPSLTREKFITKLADDLKREFGLFFVEPGFMGDHNHFRCYGTAQIKEIDFDDFLLSIFYNGKTFPLFDDSQRTYTGDPRHFPLDAQKPAVLDKVVGRVKLITAFEGRDRTAGFLNPPSTLQDYRLALPYLYDLAREDISRVLQTALLPTREKAFYQALLLQLHFIKFGVRSGVVAERNWYIPEHCEDDLRKALNYLVAKGLVYLPFSGGVFPKWELYYPSFIEAGLQQVEIFLFSGQHQLKPFAAVEAVESLPAEEKQLRTIALSQKPADLAKLVESLYPNTCALAWLATEILDQREDVASLKALEAAVFRYKGIRQLDNFISLNREDLIRIRALWLLARKSPRALADLQVGQRLSAAGFTEQGSNQYSWSAKYAQEIITKGAA